MFIKRIPRSLNLFQLFHVLDCAVLPCKGLALHASLQIRFECLVIYRASILRSEKSIVCFGIFLRTIDPHAMELYPKYSFRSLCSLQGHIYLGSKLKVEQLQMQHWNFEN